MLKRLFWIFKMLDHRLLWWLNGADLNKAIADLQEQTKSSRLSIEEACDELHKETERMREMNRRFPHVKLWEADQYDGIKVVDRSRETYLEPDFDDPMQQWLWEQAWHACAETGDWDLLTACAGIARAMRADGFL